MSDKELRELIEKLAISQLKLEEAQRKTDEQLRKTDEHLKKTDEHLKKTDEHLKKTDEQLRKTDEELRNMFKKVDARLDRVAKQLGGVTNNQGDVAEEYFINSLKEKLQIANIDFDYLIPNYVIEGKNIKDEFDILLVNGKSVAIIEVKYKVHPNDVDKLKRKIENLKKLPQYRGYDIYAGIAGFKIPQEAIEKAIKKGYFVLQRKGDIIQTYEKGLKAS